MGPAQATHPSKERLAAFLQGRLDPAAQAEVERHVSGCDACCRALHEVPDDTLVGRMRALPETTAPAASAGRAQAVPPPDDGLPGELLAHPRYRFVKLLGKGGMGEVYLAEHRLMERLVAVKVINRALMRDPHAVERFRTEVKAAARLAHPNIVTAHDADMAGDAHFLVMEYIEGVSLGRYVEKRGALPVAHACHYVRQAALGLQHAHERGMVHRDIKPQNLMLTRKGQVKVLDFGLARFAREEQAWRMTEVGTVLGTPDYIAPEQATNARQADIRADVYSLGCTLYYLLSGRTPFPAGSVTQKVTAHVERTPRPITEVQPDVPAELAQVVARMMAKDPAQRFQTPAEVAQALAPFGKSTPPVEPVAETQVSRPGPAAQTQALAEPERTITLRPTVRRRRWIALALMAVGAAALTAVCAGLGVRPWSQRPRAPGDDGDKEQRIVQPAGAQKPRVLMVLPPRTFWWPDYGPVRKALEEGGARVKVASLSTDRALPHPDQRWGGPVQPDVALQDARADDFEAIYFAGSMELAYVGDRPGAAAARALIKDMLARQKHVTALCRGVIVLADAGVLRGRPAARSRNLNQDVADDAALWDRKRPFQVAGTIITGRDSNDGEAFVREMLKRLKESQ